MVRPAEGPGAQAGFNGPRGVAIDGEGHVIVADMGNHRVRKIAPDGTVTTLAGSGTGGYADGRGAQASFYSLKAVAIDGEGHVIVADYSNHRVRKIEASGLVPPGGAAVPKGSTVVEDLLRMLSSEKHADVTFSVEGQLIRAHRCVLCARSEYFETMLGSQFREGEGSSMGQPLPVRPHAHTHTCMQANAHGLTNAHTRSHFCSHASTCTRVHARSGHRRMHACARALFTRICSSSHTEDTRKHARIRTRARLHPPTHARAHARTGGRHHPHAQVGDATAAAFRAVLHFVYSNEPLLEPRMLIDQMRCACRVAG